MMWPPGSTHIRLAKEVELNESFASFQQFGDISPLVTYQPILRKTLKDSIYAK